MTDVPMTSAESIQSLVAPNGRKFGIVNLPANPALFEIKYVDSKSGELPEEFADQLFTKRALGEDWLRKRLTRMWDHAMKNAPKAKAA